MKKGLITGLVVAMAVAIGVSWWASRQLPADIAARVDGVDFPVDSVNLFIDHARRQKPELTRRQVLDGLIEQHLFAGLEHDDHHHDQGSGRVTYSDDVLVENELFRVLRRVYVGEVQRALKALAADQPTDLFVTPVVTDKAVLAPMLTLQSGLYTDMSEDQLAAARQLVLTRIKLADGSERDLTLADVYQRQNIQLKVQLHQLNVEFLRQASAQVAAALFVINWFETQSGLSAPEVAAVKRMVEEKVHADAVLHELGMMQDIHDDNPQLRELADKVTTADIEAYYNANRDQFQRVEKVRARHIRVGSQALADQVYRELKEGLDFAEAVQRYSEADDKTAAVPGDLGWIGRDDRNTHWLRSLAFVQPLQQSSAPFRSPGGAGDDVVWEIVFLDEKVMGYQPVDSEGVRYEASRAIARERLQQLVALERDRLWQSANVRYNEKWLNDEQ